MQNFHSMIVTVLGDPTGKALDDMCHYKLMNYAQHMPNGYFVDNKDQSPRQCLAIVMLGRGDICPVGIGCWGLYPVEPKKDAPITVGGCRIEMFRQIWSVGGVITIDNTASIYAGIERYNQMIEASTDFTVKQNVILGYWTFDYAKEASNK